MKILGSFSARFGSGLDLGQQFAEPGFCFGNVDIPHARSKMATYMTILAEVGVRVKRSSADYSARSACIGSTEAARRAGIRLAPSVTAAIPASAAAIVNGSPGRSP